MDMLCEHCSHSQGKNTTIPRPEKPRRIPPLPQFLTVSEEEKTLEIPGLTS